MSWRPRRPRLTVRGAMVLVALAAIGMVALVPFGRSLRWLYDTPLSVNLFASSIVEHQVLGTRTRIGTAGRVPPRFPAGTPVAAVCTYECEALPSIPAWLPYRVEVRSTLLDPSRTPWVALESRSRSSWILTGPAGLDRARGIFASHLTPPRAAEYAIRYEVVVRDLFGRVARGGLHTGGFKAE